MVGEPSKIIPHFYFCMELRLCGVFLFEMFPFSSLQSLCSSATMQMVRTADTNELDKLIFRESDNDRKVNTNAASSK